jgi:glycosyltransferase involved in cell wall biosynthesis
LNQQDKIILFFGFIRHYKGLDLLLEAMNDSRIRTSGIKLLIAGEFYEDEKPYREIIDKHQMKDKVIMKNHFIPDDEVRNYLCAADVVVQPYRNATQSGVTPLAYHFEKPMIVTNVGGLPGLVPHKKAGLVCEPLPDAIATAITDFYALGEDYFIPHLRTEKQKYAWENLTGAIIALSTITRAEEA